MSEQLTLSVNKRTALGKGPMRRLRAEGTIPGVFYSTTGDNVAVQLPEMTLRKTWSKVRNNHVIQLDIDGETKPALIWEMVMHPFKNMVQHVDFFGVDLDKAVTLKVPVALSGTSKGVKAGGRLETFRMDVLVKALPMQIPDHIGVDVTELEIGQRVSVADLDLPEGVTAFYDDNYPIVAVTTGRGGADDLEEGEGEEAAEEAAEEA